MAPTLSNGGLFGKIPSLGDFFTRRLPSHFVSAWDDWLSRSIAASQSDLGEAWTRAYLSSPPWRFALDPGLAGPEGWIGILASSIDQFQRCYPITIAIPLPPGTRLSKLDGEIDTGATALETIALQLIAGTLSLEMAAAALDLAAPRLLSSAFVNRNLRHVSGACLRASGARPSIAMMATRPGDVDGYGGPPRGVSLWWHEHWNGAPPVAVVATGLPAPEVFSGLLDGRWRDHGWFDELA
jgi:type VI secretion system protein ImpM